VLITSGGLRAVVEAFVGHLPPEQEHLHAHLKLAQLLCSVPARLTPAAYLSALGPQLASLLHTRAEDRPLVARLCALVIGGLCQRSPAEAWQLVLRPLLLPLLPPERPAA
jgi:hypothetical protein